MIQDEPRSAEGTTDLLERRRAGTDVLARYRMAENSKWSRQLIDT